MPRARNLQPELMDNPNLDPRRFLGSLEGLRRVNIVTGSARILLPHIIQAAAEDRSTPLRVLDVACGGGDVLVALSKRLRARGLEADMHGCDCNSLAVEHAARHARTVDVPASFFQLKVLEEPLPEGYDLVMSSLFLHHLSNRDASVFLKQAATVARETLLIHDLARSSAGYALAKVGTRALLCNDVCHADGPQSVAGAFTISEVSGLAADAGLEGYSVQARFPFRFLLKWQKP